VQKSEQINELAAAMAKAQAQLENAAKSSNNPHFKSKYADLAEILNTVRPAFSANGLSVTQCPSFEAGIASVETVLMHSSGQWMSSVISAPVGKQDAQGVGSAITYCRRYSLAAIAGIAQEDDDGSSAVGYAPKAPAYDFVAAMADIRSAADLGALQAIFTAAFRAASNDQNMQSRLTQEKDKRKAQLQPVGETQA
jgi:hypothetical protein